jgi:hypothetical protein
MGGGHRRGQQLSLLGGVRRRWDPGPVSPSAMNSFMGFVFRYCSRWGGAARPRCDSRASLVGSPPGRCAAVAAGSPACAARRVAAGGGGRCDRGIAGIPAAPRRLRSRANRSARAAAQARSRRGWRGVLLARSRPNVDSDRASVPFSSRIRDRACCLLGSPRQERPGQTARPARFEEAILARSVSPAVFLRGAMPMGPARARAGRRASRVESAGWWARKQSRVDVVGSLGAPLAGACAGRRAIGGRRAGWARPSGWRPRARMFACGSVALRQQSKWRAGS